MHHLQAIQVVPFQLHYISPNQAVGGGSGSGGATSIYAYIGTPPQLRRQSKLVWRQVGVAYADCIYVT